MNAILTSLLAQQRLAKINREKETVAGPPSIPYTPRLKKVMALAVREAKHRGHNYIGTEHIFAGLLREGESFCCQFLNAAGITMEDAEAILKSITDEEL